MSVAHRLFDDRRQAGLRLAEALAGIPRGGLEVAFPVARALGAELDVALARKLRAAHQPELALGAICESGEVFLTQHARRPDPREAEHLERESDLQRAEIRRRAEVFRRVRPRAPMRGRSVIIIDDGIATGSTMIAALHAARAEGAAQLIAAAPVAPRDRLQDLQRLCDHVVCLFCPEDFFAIGQFYRDFEQVPESRAVELVRDAAGAGQAG